MTIHRRRDRIRLAATGVLTALALTVVAAAPAAATPPQTHNRVDAAAGWLARQMVDGERFEVVFGGVAYPDQGLTIDAIFTFAAAKEADSYATNAITWLAEPAVTTGYIGDGTEAYAGATAKLALGAQVRGLDPTSFGGVDLLTRLTGLMTPSGRFSDQSAFGDYSNMFSQSFAVLALDRAGGAPAQAVSFLTASQCPDGGFPLQLAQTTCTSDVDATAMAVQALVAAGEWHPAQTAAQWLVSVQATDGSFTAGGVANANSTGLAAQALVATGRVLAWWQARQFLLSLQVNCAGDVADRGAIAYTTTGLDPATAPRATAQAVPGLAAVSLVTLSANGSRPDAPTLACA
ncbi:prenyltransferase/squalene oxidase repeat-containing protein [Micromonospora sp. NBC_01813]|uniref:prenyltransferase/squalene oxidase repeat-containing protein n=1 Tax=Micromonospora sp. NBC_01813 TaxID=2975988 RepID=UPI002DDBA9E3|nr:prenyltransferase/squalene oxidase repeat-containing protein [Micromonospora sp. NBC_01813]WSA10826.1 terpene cyclase/mutase family protein [Micromonospora sp. NBC_01813]